MTYCYAWRPLSRIVRSHLLLKDYWANLKSQIFLDLAARFRGSDILLNPSRSEIYFLNLCYIRLFPYLNMDPLLDGVWLVLDSIIKTRRLYNETPLQYGVLSQWPIQAFQQWALPLQYGVCKPMTSQIVYRLFGKPSFCVNFFSLRLRLLDWYYMLHFCTQKLHLS